MLDVDALGLDVMDRKLLLGGDREVRRRPGRAWTTSPRAIGEERDTIEDVLEPYLIQQGYLQRTPRGRMATPTGLSAFRPRRARRRSQTALRRPVLGTSEPVSAGRCASTTRTPTPAAWCITPTTSSSSSARAPNGCARLGFEQRCCCAIEQAWCSWCARCRSIICARRALDDLLEVTVSLHAKSARSLARACTDASCAAPNCWSTARRQAGLRRRSDVQAR